MRRGMACAVFAALTTCAVAQDSWTLMRRNTMQVLARGRPTRENRRGNLRASDRGKSRHRIHRRRDFGTDRSHRNSCRPAHNARYSVSAFIGGSFSYRCPNS